ncbi:MAG: hypothetical protein JZD41_07675 [Thermoproteus sp.]|nr:hypothetical protein [Thermoproteus sp.]
MSLVAPSEKKVEIVDGRVIEQYIRKRSEEGYAVKCRKIVFNYICEAVKL